MFLLFSSPCRNSGSHIDTSLNISVSFDGGVTWHGTCELKAGAAV